MALEAAGFSTKAARSPSPTAASLGTLARCSAAGSATLARSPSPSTFSGNQSAVGGGIGTLGGTVTLENTIVANSPAGSNCSGTITDGGGNLSWPDTTCPGINGNPLLGSLQPNGGPTYTMALGAGSAALNVAVLANCPSTDQRGITRPQGTGCDIGAFELVPLGALDVCKVAGSGVVAGQIFNINVNGAPLEVPAGQCVGAGAFPAGTNVTAQEVVPSGYQVSAITVGGNATLVSANLGTGKAVVVIGASQNTVTFTNDEIPPPSIGAFTLGYWKNAAPCDEAEPR